MWRKMPRSRTREEELIERIRNNEQRAMSELYYMYANALTSVCYRYLLQEEDVKDVLQESFVSIFTTIGKFRPQHEQSLKSWMVRIAINRSIPPLSLLIPTSAFPDAPACLATRLQGDWNAPLPNTIK